MLHAAKEVAISTYAAELASANNKVSEFAMELSAKSSVASELTEQVSQLQAKLLDASQRDMDAQKAQDELQQELSDRRCAAGWHSCAGLRSCVDAMHAPLVDSLFMMRVAEVLLGLLREPPSL